MDRTLAIQYFMRNSNDFLQARSELYAKGVKSSYDKKKGLMIFSANKRAKTNLLDAYTQEANGLILEMKSWKAVMIPPRSLRRNIDTDASNVFLHRGLYHIYKVEDGTSINMYYRDGKWTISTTNGYEMNDTKWGELTYQQMLTECLEKIGISWQEFCSQLSVNSCYSFGFKHPSLHKFREGKELPVYKIWFIQSVVTDETSDKYLWSSNQTPIAVIPVQEMIKDIIANLSELYTNASVAYDKFVESKEICYGYILRSANIDQTKSHSDLYIESSLIRYIRHFWYDSDIIERCNEKSWDKEKAIVLFHFLCVEEFDKFIALFPQYTASTDKFNKLLSSIADRMYKRAEDSLQPLADRCLEYMKKTIKYNIVGKSQKDVCKFYYEFICSPMFIDEYIDLF